MRVLLAHNFYQLAGGEDVVFEAEAQMLERFGHEVFRYTVDNDAITHMSSWRSGINTLWNRKTYREIAALCRERKPDVAHFHNTFPLMSPSVYYSARRCGVPVVQTLHNFRLVCPNGLFFRDGHVCEDCLGKLLSLPAVRYCCYRGSRAASAVTAEMLAFHRLRGTWTRQIDAYIALTDFGKGKFVEGGLPANKVYVKPHFLAEDPGEGAGDGGFALFAGRLAPEKGLGVLLDAWRSVGARMPLKIVGTGPLEESVGSRAAEIDGVEVLGHVERDSVAELMKSASCLVFPSLAYEGFGLSIIEALAVGLPVIASSHGSGAGLIQDGVTGMLIRCGDAADLAAKVSRAIDEPSLLRGMRPACRQAFLDRFTADSNHEMLMDIYEAARGARL